MGKNIFTIIGALFVIAICVLFISLISTILWFCFDDAPATLTGVPALGTQNWYHVWPFTMFVASLFKAYLSTKS